MGERAIVLRNGEALMALEDHPGEGDQLDLLLINNSSPSGLNSLELYLQVSLSISAKLYRECLRGARFIGHQVPSLEHNNQVK
ncbi:hypothetical protein GUJ93_ZPchr0006g42378 [Zizania palustris]|uniref:Uncharacterized protein n=1 Tax=Zizania palustris TaxID=103762 RepID=A0A8J5SIB3_ZIZPA|nr:hypothetical protein GUJ93_ZPchr0006g42378 [Zizania palustris]